MDTDYKEKQLPYMASLHVFQGDCWQKTKNQKHWLHSLQGRITSGLKASLLCDPPSVSGSKWTKWIFCLPFPRLSILSHLHILLSPLGWPLSCPSPTVDLKTPAYTSRLSSNFTSSWPYQNSILLCATVTSHFDLHELPSLLSMHCPPLNPYPVLPRTLESVNCLL